MQPLRRANPPHDYRAELFELIRTRSFGRGKIMLASGRASDFYFDLRPTTIHPPRATAGGGRDPGRAVGRDREPSARRQAAGLLRAQEAEGSWRQEDDRGPAEGGVS